MMEYLINVKGMSLKQVMADSVTKDIVYQEVMAWRESLEDQNQPSVDCRLSSLLKYRKLSS